MQIEEKKVEINRHSKRTAELEYIIFYLYREEKKNLRIKGTYEKQEKHLYQAYQYLQQTKSRKDMLEEMEDDYAGFFQGVKEVLKARGRTLMESRGL